MSTKGVIKKRSKKKVKKDDIAPLKKVIQPMTKFQQEQWLSRMSEYIKFPFTPAIRRMYRKLVVKKKLRQFNYFKSSRHNFLVESHYCTIINNTTCTVDFENESIVGIVKCINYTPIKCTYTLRNLRPIIRRGHSKTPLWLRMHSELRAKVKLKFPHLEVEVYDESFLEFVYVRREHLQALVSLANLYFWPFIDLTYVLDFPEFSCVVLYKKLIVGFAFAAPGTFSQENYISFIFVRPHWRNCGIATFMIYHLIHTCENWDFTLHVSLNNPSLFLYQKFGFKAQRVYLNFYEKYFRADSKECPHAMFCILQR